jgi:phosphatidate cytidylyltransferase
MKQRVISAIVALLIFIPIFIIGGVLFDISFIILAVLGLHEFLKIREEKKEIPVFISFIAYILLILIVATGITTKEMVFTIDFRIISALILVFLVPTVLYHDRSIYSIVDAFYLIGGVFFLGVSFSLFIIYRNIDLKILIYLFTITIMTDTYAFIIGRLIGKHKLLENISPNKTLEGMISGTFLGTFLGTLVYEVLFLNSKNILVIILVTLFLSVLGQLGDLAFSAIKRYFGKKDFSNIMPGHGGILDRLDSSIFVLLGFLFFTSII